MTWELDYAKSGSSIIAKIQSKGHVSCAHLEPELSLTIPCMMRYKMPSGALLIQPLFFIVLPGFAHSCFSLNFAAEHVLDTTSDAKDCPAFGV